MSGLQEMQKSAGARFGDRNGAVVALDYGDPEAEYRAVREEVGLLAPTPRGFLVLTGRDRFTWLQGMVTNDVRPLAEQTPFVPACILNATGHLLAELTIVNRGDSLLLDLDRRIVDSIYRLLDNYLITEQVEIVDQSDFLVRLSVQGRHVERTRLREAVGEEPLLLARDHTGAGGYDLYVRATDAPHVWERLQEAKFKPVGETAANVLRVEAGIPRFGQDMDETTIPLEAGLGMSHISYTKGCYVGQEIIARIQSRGHTNRALTGLQLDDAPLPTKGDRIFPAEGETAREIGWITSAVVSPRFGAIALGYVRHEQSEPETMVQVVGADGTRRTATITPLPFLTSSP